MIAIARKVSVKSSRTDAAGESSSKHKPVKTGENTEDTRTELLYKSIHGVDQVRESCGKSSTACNSAMFISRVWLRPSEARKRWLTASRRRLRI